MHLPTERSTSERANSFVPVAVSPLNAALANDDQVPSFLALVNYAQGLQVTVTPSVSTTPALAATDSGKTFLLDRASVTYTLPAAAVGLRFRFISTVASSTTQKIITKNTGSEFLIGAIMSGGGTAGDGSVWAGNGSSHVSVNMNGSTKGGLVGTVLDFYCVTATIWHVSGLMVASSTEASPFATS